MDRNRGRKEQDGGFSRAITQFLEKFFTEVAAQLAC